MHPVVMPYKTMYILLLGTCNDKPKGVNFSISKSVDHSTFPIFSLWQCSRSD